MNSRSACLAPLVVILAGCATTGVNPPDKKIIVSEDQTEIITPIGSHMRTRVLKGQVPISTSPTESVSGAQINDSLLTRDGNIPAVPVR